MIYIYIYKDDIYIKMILNLSFQFLPTIPQN